MRIKRARSQGVLRISGACVCDCAVMILPRVNRYQSVYEIETDRYRICASIRCAYRVILVMPLQLYIGELHCLCSFVRSFVRLNRTSVQRNEIRIFCMCVVSVLLLRCEVICLCYFLSHVPFFSIILIRFCCVLGRVFVCVFFALAL